MRLHHWFIVVLVSAGIVVLVTSHYATMALGTRVPNWFTRYPMNINVSVSSGSIRFHFMEDPFEGGISNGFFSHPERVSVGRTILGKYSLLVDDSEIDVRVPLFVVLLVFVAIHIAFLVKRRRTNWVT